METRYRKSIDTKDSHVVLRASIKEISGTLLSLKRSYIIRMAKYVRKLFVPISHSRRKKARKEMHFLQCDVEPEEILPLI